MRRGSVESERQAGLGLIEIVVSMFVLALLTLAVLPVLVTGLRTSEANASQATAGQLASSTIENARSRAPKCADLAAFISSSPATSVSRGTVLTATVSPVLSCSAIPSYPVTVPVMVKVIDSRGKSYATASARVLLTQP
ncbi:hypothetical protein [Gryllotalpicola koreensis]|uniref:Type II secretion system protein n=1 Tax=Gryllotalpicola koreensis TaxID=993086 RepID=A0ABP8A4L9_9MICO